MLETVHKRVADKAVIQSLDDDYNDLRASVNGLLERIASDVENNTMHQDVWQQHAGTVIQEARDFYRHAKNAGLVFIRSAIAVKNASTALCTPG